MYPHESLSAPVYSVLGLFCAGVSFLNLIGLISNHLTLFTGIHIILKSYLSVKFLGFWLDNVMKELLTVTSVTMIYRTKN